VDNRLDVVFARADAAQSKTRKTTTMKLFALLAVAVSLVLVGCDKSEAPPAAPNTNAPAK